MNADAAATGVAEESSGDSRVAIMLAMAMFVLVVDTSLMNVSISAVVHDLHTTGAASSRRLRSRRSSRPHSSSSAARSATGSAASARSSSACSGTPPARSR
jgi:hypothetical protein